MTTRSVTTGRSHQGNGGEENWRTARLLYLTAHAFSRRRPPGEPYQSRPARSRARATDELPSSTLGGNVGGAMAGHVRACDHTNRPIRYPLNCAGVQASRVQRPRSACAVIAPRRPPIMVTVVRASMAAVNSEWTRANRGSTRGSLAIRGGQHLGFHADSWPITATRGGRRHVSNDIDVRREQRHA